MSCKKNPENVFLLALSPVGTTEEEFCFTFQSRFLGAEAIAGGCLRARRAPRSTFIFTCNHFLFLPSCATHPTLWPPLRLPRSPPSASQYELIMSYYLTQLPSGSASLLSPTLTRTHTHICRLLLFFFHLPAPSLHHKHTHIHKVIRCTNLLYFFFFFF